MALGEVAASWLSCSHSSMGTALTWQSCCPPPALPLSSALYSQPHVKSNWRAGASSRTSQPGNFQQGQGQISVRPAAVCSEVIYLHSHISCKYWQNLRLDCKH